MLRWLVRKVVQLVMEEIEARRLAQGTPRASDSIPARQMPVKEAVSAKDVDKAVTKETMRSLAGAAMRGPTIEADGMRPGKTVVVDGGKSKDTIDRLAGIGT